MQKSEQHQYENLVRGKSEFVNPITKGQKTLCKMYDMEHGSVVDTSLGAQIIQKFVAENDMDVLCENIQMSVALDISYFEVIAKIKTVFDKSRAVCPTFRKDYVIIHGELKGHKVLAMVSSNSQRSETSRDDDDDAETVGTLDLRIDLYGEPETVKLVSKAVSGLFTIERIATVKWWYQGNHGPTSRDIHLPVPTTKLYPEFYPDLGDPYKFMDAYLASDASVLLLAGPPGTGKTTFLRHMVVERKLKTHVIIDEKLMERDAIFQDFLFDGDSQMMIIEDSDTILSSREDDGNKMMSRFLSVSDGLIKLPNKKLVFTTNLADFSRIDPALLRPGRCYRVVNMRCLSHSEAMVAAEKAGIFIGGPNREWTLAEIFNQGYTVNRRRVGFV